VQYARLGDTGLIVSRLALGTLTFGEGQGALASLYKVDQAGAQRLVGQALDAGVNYFNTADVYCEGRSEEMLGRALGARRKQSVIATKVGHRTGAALLEQGLSRRHILAAVESSLKRLGTDWIDVYLLHRLDPYTPVEETLAALEQLIVAGKIRYIGFSNWPAWLAAKAVGIQRANGWEPFRAAEMYYSLLGRDIEHEVAPLVLDAGIGLQIWGPLAGGFLSGRYSKQDPTGGGGRLAGYQMIPFDRKLGDRIIDALRAIASTHGATPSQVALAWLLSRPAVTSVLVGASRGEQLADSLKAVELILTPSELAALEALSAPGPVYPGGWYTEQFSDQATRDVLGHRDPG
jgi:aryl-alcohol dehydrogenase-like predicted oxidoreductase